MNVIRRLPDGSRRAEETVNQSQIYVTTAGWKNSFAYEKLIETLVKQIIDPDHSIVLGGTWKVPLAEGLLEKSFISDLRMSGTFNESSFGREYGSEWSGDGENAFFSSETFDKHRVLLLAENEYSNKISKNGYYILGVDVGRRGCTTEIIVIKVSPQAQGAAFKSIVNLYTIEAEHFEEQAVALKKLFYKYQARAIAVDANGLGIGFVDYLVKSQTDAKTGTTYPDFGVINDEDGSYKQYKTGETEHDVLYLIKANAPINTEAHAYVQTQMSSGKVKFLIDENQAKVKLSSTKMGQTMSDNSRAKYLRPYVLTTILKEQLLNLTEENDKTNIILKQASRGIAKDKFSAFEYGMLYIKKIEDSNKRKKTRNLAGLSLFTSVSKKR